MSISVPDLNNNGSPPMAHLLSCRLHDEDGPAICSGYLRRSRTFHCTKKAIISPEPNMMPTCRLHRGQLKRSSLCQIPIELRVRIYGYLLPDRDIPAQYHSYELRSDADRSSICMGLLRVNRQIHDEAVGLLYGCRTFTIQLMSAAGLGMCNFRQHIPNQHPGGNHVLQDYQMQLMLLEQQNRKRLIMARNLPPPPPLAGPSTAPNGLQGPGPMLQPQPLSAQFVGFTLPRMFQGSTPSGILASSIVPPAPGPIWDSPLSPRYFDEIRSFRIEICLPTSPSNNSTTQRYYYSQLMSSGRNTLRDADTARQELESRIYEYSDHLHKLVSRLQLTHRRLSRLVIFIKFGDMYSNGNGDEALSAMDILLRPFRRLCNVGSTEVLASHLIGSVGSDEKQEVPYLINNITPHPKSKHGISEASETFNEYLATFCDSLSASTPSLIPTPAFHAYWKFDALLLKINFHCHHAAAMANPDLKAGFEQFTDLRQRARVAREDEDLDNFKAMFQLVMAIWQRYLDWERWFQEDIGSEIRGLWDVVAEGDV
ncbi:uncharacterized protein PAC_18579 [Phialocephala subalpina]|uniref:Probable treble clef zinc finger domain-containing protein n=1 Tax=Phialocephala subalpina TaxID=576137 RepID=A0A1L7XUI5_9HELO|nr:uncharacterized protein PAC_18579 [Phialocephala subalpina]